MVLYGWILETLVSKLLPERKPAIELHPDEEQAVQTAAGGIRVNGATDCTIRENYVASPGPDKLFFVGLDVLDGSGSVFNCNTFTELGTGTSAGRFYQDQVR